MGDYELLLVEDVSSAVRRITLNRPKKRNALNNAIRGEIFAALEEADRDPQVRVSILRGAGKCFSAGYDLGANNAVDQPYHTAGGDGSTAASIAPPPSWLRPRRSAIPMFPGCCL